MCKYDTTLGNKDVNVDCAALLDDLVNGKFNVGYRQILSNKKNYLDTSKLCSSDFSGTIGSIHYNSTDYFTKLYDNIVNSSAEIKCASIPVAEIVTQDKSIYENFNVALTICKCDDLTFFKQYNGCDLSVGKTYTIPFYAEIAFDGKNYTLIQLSQGQMTTKDLEQWGDFMDQQDIDQRKNKQQKIQSVIVLIIMLILVIFTAIVKHICPNPLNDATSAESSDPFTAESSTVIGSSAIASVKDNNKKSGISEKESK